MIKKLIASLTLLGSLTALAAIDINKASQADLDGLKGIGPATTKLILAERKKREFKDWHDLQQRVKGLGPTRASKLSAEGLTVAGSPYGTTHAAVASGSKKEPLSPQTTRQNKEQRPPVADKIR